MSENSDYMAACWLPDDISFDEWVNYVFDHPILEPQWWFQRAESGYLQLWKEDELPEVTLDYMTRLFRDPVFLIERFTRPEIDQGLNFLVSDGCSKHMFVLLNDALPWPARRACFDALISLYEKLMAPVYGNNLEHNRTMNSPEPPDGPNYACYMWWDIIPLRGGMDHLNRRQINHAVLHVFEEVLKLDSEACLESALHGLGHWHAELPEQVRAIVKGFLERTDISPELRRYAERAAMGCVL